MRYNFIVVTELLQDPVYAAAVERFFGVPSVEDKRYHPQCEFESIYANERIPLIEEKGPIQKLMQQNGRDVHLYHELKNCLGNYDFPTWDPNRFDTNKTIQVHYNITEERWVRTMQPTAPNQTWLENFNKIHMAS